MEEMSPREQIQNYIGGLVGVTGGTPLYSHRRGSETSGGTRGDATSPRSAGFGASAGEAWKPQPLQGNTSSRTSSVEGSLRRLPGTRDHNRRIGFIYTATGHSPPVWDLDSPRYPPGGQSSGAATASEAMSQPPGEESPPAGGEEAKQDAVGSAREEEADGSGGGEGMKSGKGEGERRERRGSELKEGRKGGGEEEDGVPPALPPRPPPRPRQACSCSCALEEGEVQERSDRGVPRYCWANGLRKYVFLCTACGSLSVLLGALFLIVYFMLKSYTSSLNHFETVPTYVPSGMLIVTGFLIMCLACRKNRNSFLMKLCGLCSLCCAILCVSVTVTTTVIHMNKLQTLRECLYTLKTQSCTCYSVLMDNDRISDEGIKFVFNSTPDCEVIHGALYSCLRAIFGLSVIGILVCIFTCMLVYQLLSHEKKKMYWAQLEMRCRYLYRHQRSPHYYTCCDECRYPTHPHELFSWDLMGSRLWSAGRIGNLYTPNPEDRGGAGRLRSGWNWRRLPWSRTGTSATEPSRTNLGSPDSQYGFSSTNAVEGTPYTVLDPRTAPGIPSCHPGLPPAADISEGGFYSWGPPPPYASNRNSANNSPARRSLGDILHQVSPIRRNDNVSPARTLHHPHRHHLHRQCTSASRQVPSAAQNPPDAFQKPAPLRTTPITNAIQQQQSAMNPLWSNSLSSVHCFQKALQNKTNYENMCDPPAALPTNGFNTLPSLKRRAQPRLGDIFRDDPNAYFFSSAENLGCSTANVSLDAPDDSLPPRVFLQAPHPSPRYPPPPPHSAFKTPPDAGADLPTLPPDAPDGADGRRNASLVRKLLVNCSPSKQKPRQEGLPPDKPALHTPKKKASKALEAKDVDKPAITLHCRSETIWLPEIYTRKLFGGERWGAEEAESEGQKPRGRKCGAKEAEVLRQHDRLFREFQKNLDLHKYRDSDPGKEKPAFPKSFPSDLRRSPADARQPFPDPPDDCAHQKPAENDSDVYFADISNSSCYVSLPNDPLDPNIYEDAPRFSSSGHPLLSKHNLKIIDSAPPPDKHPDPNHTRHPHPHRHRPKPPPDDPPRDDPAPPSPLPHDHFTKNPRRPHSNPLKYFPPALTLHPYHPHESTDEHSSGSLTADSGVSSARSFPAPHFDPPFRDLDPKPPDAPRPDDTPSPLDFSHPLFQKPKPLPRPDRYKDPDPPNDPDPDPKRKRPPKAPDDLPNQLLTTCSLTLARDHFLDDPAPPQPLPRTSVLKPPDDLFPTPPPRYLHSDALDHLIAPDAQYDFRDTHQADPKPNAPAKPKPAVPARPLSLQPDHKKTAKADSLSLRLMRAAGEGGRRQAAEDAGGGEGGEMGAHSVNV